MMEAQYISVEINKIHVQRDASGQVLNPRGTEFETADLEASYKFFGAFVDPIRIKVHPELDGEFYLQDGHRRFKAAKKLKLDMVDCLLVTEDVAKDQRLVMLATSVRQPNPPLAEALAVKILVDGEFDESGAMVKAGKSYMDIARATGKSPDEISALYELVSSAHPEIQKAVRSGRMGKSVFARIKHIGTEAQERLIEDTCGKEKITLKFVKAWSKEQKGAGNATVENKGGLGDVTGGESTDSDEDSIVEQLNGVLAVLNGLIASDEPLGPLEKVVLSTIESRVSTLKTSNIEKQMKAYKSTHEKVNFL